MQSHKKNNTPRGSGDQEEEEDLKDLEEQMMKEQEEVTPIPAHREEFWEEEKDSS